MRRFKTGLIIMGLMVLGLNACGSKNVKETGASVEDTVNVTETVAETTDESIEETTEKETMTETENYDRESSMAAYRQALENIYTDQLFPDGLVRDLMGGEVTENQFAVYDVDHDGREELILEYTTSSMAAMMAGIYDYDEETGMLREELIEFPTLTYYDNLVIEAGVSHNQGFAGDFWPYSYYIYDEEKDIYECIYYVDAWDKAMSDVNYDGSVFPDDADEDGDGIVYYLRKSWDSEAEPMDRDAYDAWHAASVGIVEEIPFMNLTEDNISSIH